MLSSLRLVPRLRLEKVDADSGKGQRAFLDFEVNGGCLRAKCERVRPGITGDLIACLGWLPLDSDERRARELLCDGPATGPEGRLALLVCPECGDIGCQAITAKIARIDATYLWKEFRLENGRDDESGVLIPLPLETVCFPAEQYRRAIESRPQTTYKRQ